MDKAQALLDETNFVTLHGVLTFAGCFLSLIVMQLTSWADLDRRDPRWLQWTNRVMRVALAMALLWSFEVVTAQGWDPFRPGIAVLIALDLGMVFRVVTLALEIRRQERANPKGGGDDRHERLEAGYELRPPPLPPGRVADRARHHRPWGLH